jgi:hypothetical protein
MLLEWNRITPDQPTLSRVIHAIIAGTPVTIAHANSCTTCFLYTLYLLRALRNIISHIVTYRHFRDPKRGNTIWTIFICLVVYIDSSRARL